MEVMVPDLCPAHFVCRGYVCVNVQCPLVSLPQITQPWGYRSSLPHTPYCMSIVVCTQVLMPAQQVLHSLSHLPNPFLDFFLRPGPLTVSLGWLSLLGLSDLPSILFF